MIVEDACQDDGRDRANGQADAARAAHRSQVLLAFVVEIDHRAFDTEYSGPSVTGCLSLIEKLMVAAARKARPKEIPHHMAKSVQRGAGSSLLYLSG